MVMCSGSGGSVGVSVSAGVGVGGCGVVLDEEEGRRRAEEEEEVVQRELPPLPGFTRALRGIGLGAVSRVAPTSLTDDHDDGASLGVPPPPN
jgi:hypothetical protein